MNPQEEFKIDVTQSFEHLARAPIVEAVVEIRAHTTRDWREEEVRADLHGKLSNYEFLDSQKAFKYEMKIEQGKPSHAYRDLGWNAVRFQSGDKKLIARFSKDGFSFSRLEPYQDWQRLSEESSRLWMIFREMAQPQEIGRIGVRFINRIYISPGDWSIEDYVFPAPQTPRGLDLPFQDFTHRDILAVPGYPYLVNVTTTMQCPSGEDDPKFSIILDIDVFTTQKSEPEESVRVRQLEEMRWLKNKVFFGSVSDRALENLR